MFAPMLPSKVGWSLGLDMPTLSAGGQLLSQNPFYQCTHARASSVAGSMRAQLLVPPEMMPGAFVRPGPALPLATALLQGSSAPA